MGFGGVRQSGTGWKEAGVEALDVYSETRYVNLVVDPGPHVTGRIAVLGLGGIGGLLAARTGALCVGSERTVDAIGERGLRLVQGGETTHARLEAVTRLDTPVALLVVAVKSYHLDGALDRVAPEALDGAMILPLQNGLEHVAAIRARVEGAHHRPSVAAGSIGHVSASSPEPGLVVQETRTAARISAASHELEAAELAERLAPLAVPGIEVVVGDDEGAVLWEKAARLSVLAAATVARRPLDRRAPRRSGVAPASRGGARRGMRGRGRRRRRARRRSPMGDDRRHAPRPDDVRRARCRRRPTRPSSTRSPAPSSAPARGSASRRPCSPSSSRRRRAARRSADRRARRLGARPGEECPPSRGPPAARLRDRDRAAVGGLRPDRRLDRQRADRPGRAVVRRRRPVPAARTSTATVDVPGHRVDRVDAAAARRALRAVRDRAGDEPVPRAGRHPARARAAARDARGRLDPRGRAGQAASREDVDRRRGSTA